MKSSETTDPLAALLIEWRQMSLQFWVAVIAALALTQTEVASLAWILGVVAIGMPLLLLGQTVVIISNEERKLHGAAPQDEFER